MRHGENSAMQAGDRVRRSHDIVLRSRSRCGHILGAASNTRSIGAMTQDGAKHASEERPTATAREPSKVSSLVGLEDLSPAYFGMVMATGIVSLAAHLLGLQTI